MEKKQLKTETAGGGGGSCGGGIRGSGGGRITSYGWREKEGVSSLERDQMVTSCE